MSELSDLQNVTCLVMDISRKESVQLAMDEVFAKEGRVDYCINNAAFGLAPSPLVETNIQSMRDMFETNVWGTLQVCRSFVEHHVPTTSGDSNSVLTPPVKLLICGSFSSQLTLPFTIPYSASKYALRSFAYGLRAELWPLGVEVSLVEFGRVKTKFGDNVKEPSSSWDVLALGRRSFYEQMRCVL
ncbi:hypothetical protein HDU93_003638 [Gonapodya sp. JEL0774]|nr:hypothetical protein HDU93_003638 [Gonapodya sp. JEL0774]